MKKLILLCAAFLSFPAFADQSGTYICRNIDVFYGGTNGGTWKVVVSKNYEDASIVFTYSNPLEFTESSFPSSPVFKLKRVGTNWGHLRFEELISYEGISSLFSFNLMGMTDDSRDALQSKDAVLTQIQDGYRTAHLCVKI